MANSMNKPHTTVCRLLYERTLRAIYCLTMLKSDISRRGMHHAAIRLRGLRMPVDNIGVCALLAHTRAAVAG
jgi:hypothetical protein